MKPLRKLFSSPFSVEEQKLTSNYCKTPNQTPSSCRHIEARLGGIASLHVKLMKSTHLTPPNDYQKYVAYSKRSDSGERCEVKKAMKL